MNYNTRIPIEIKSIRARHNITFYSLIIVELCKYKNLNPVIILIITTNN